MTQNNEFLDQLSSISDSLSYIKPIENDQNINKEYVDSYTTRQQKDRDIKITELLSEYVNSYKSKTKTNKWYKIFLFATCILGLFVFSIIFIILILKVDFSIDSNSIANVAQLASICITFLGLIIGLLQTITRYVFPENEEEYITRIVEIIQNNDLENKKENIKVHQK